MSKKEHVLAIRAQSVNLDAGFTRSSGDLDKVFAPESVMIGSREWLETDENFLQLIPYCMVKSLSGNVLAYSRTAQGGEKRLQGKVSVGLGGHINIADVDTLLSNQELIGIKDTVAFAIDREIEEELGLEASAYTAEFKGFIYDPSNAVGRVHLGLLMICTLNAETDRVKHLITSPDAGLNMFGFFPPEYLLSGEDDIELENWSRMCLEGVQ